MRPTRDIPLKTGAKGITFAPCPETLWLIECSQFSRRRASIFNFGEFAQKLNAIRANYPISGELSAQIGSDKKPKFTYTARLLKKCKESPLVADQVEQIRIRKVNTQGERVQPVCPESRLEQNIIFNPFLKAPSHYDETSAWSFLQRPFY